MAKTTRKVLVQFPNPGRKPVSKISDRAKRYRANNEANRPKGARRCGYCANPENVDVDHIDGHEERGEPENLMYLCRSCNVTKANVMRRRGLGRKTAQYNPRKRGGRRAELDDYAAAIKVMRGQWDGDISKAMQTIRSAPASLRSEYTSRTWAARKAIYGPSGRQSEIPF